MSILYPLMALGVLFVAVPIWLHLRRRDETNLIHFSALRFLDDQPIARARPLWPRNWPLLLLRMLALLLLVAAFMWPYFEDEQTAIVEESRIYILDNTLSHQVEGGFQQAKEQVVRQLRSEDLRTQIGVVELSSSPRVLARLGDPGSAAAESVENLEPSASRAEFIDAFRTAGEMLQTSLGSKRRIVLLSDSQANQWTQGDDVAPFLKDIEIELPAVPVSARPNLSLSGPRARRRFEQGEHRVAAGVMLACRGSAESVTVVFRNRGREVAREVVSLEPAETLQERPVMAEWAVDPLDWVTGEVVIDSASDSLTEDDRVVFSLPPQVPGQVMLLADSLFLREALSPEVMQGRWQLQETEPSGRTDPGSEPPQPADILCVESKMLTDSTVRDTVRDALSEGQGVILFVDRATPVIAGFLRDLGIEMELPDDSPRSQAAPSPATFRYLFMEHPIFAPFQSSAFGNLAEVEISRYRKLSIREAIPLAFAASGDPLVFEVNAGPGRMLVFAFAFHRDDTNWPIHPSFIPFLDKALGYLRHQPALSNAFEPGQSIAWEAPGGRVDGEIQIAAIDPESLRLRDRGGFQVAAQVRDGRANFQIPGATGHYAVRWEGDDRLVGILDVNPSPLESDLTYTAEPEAVNAWQRESEENIQPNANDSPSNGLELTRLEALQQHVWWYLLLAALVAFLLETAFSSRRVQQTD